MTRPLTTALLLAAFAAGPGEADVPRLSFRADLDGSLEPQAGAGPAEARGTPTFAPVETPRLSWPTVAAS